MKGKKGTGCDILDAHKVKASASYDRPDLCLKCPYPKCVLKNRDKDLKEVYHPPEIREVYLRCKTCGAIETLIMTNGKLQKQGRWHQIGDTIYHLSNFGICEQVKFY